MKQETNFLEMRCGDGDKPEMRQNLEDDKHTVREERR